jgi:hypothetical protein
MPRPMMFFVSAILFMPLGTVLVTQASLAEPASDECKTRPGSSAPAGSHWYYRINRTDQRRCWFLGPEGAYGRSQARETRSNVSLPTRTPPRENAVETARAIPARMELAQRTPLEDASTASAAADFAAPLSELPKIPDLDARGPTTIDNNSTDSRERPEARKEMPLIRPVLTEAKDAGLQDPAPENVSMPVFLVGVLMVLLCAGASFKLARRKTQSYRHNRRVVSSRPRRLHPGQKMGAKLHPGQKMRANISEPAARSNDFARRSVSGARRGPNSLDPAHDIKASLRKIMDDLQRVAA